MTDQFDNQLFDAFDDFAAAERSTAKQAPGSAAVRRTVAVQRRNRYTMLSLLAAAVVAIPVAAYAANPRGNNSPPLPGASVTASDSPSAPASPSDSPSGSPSATVTDPVPGMYLYREDKADGTITNDILHRAVGGDWQKIATVKGPTNAAPVVSPDHKHIAWLLNGQLQVSALDGSQVKTVVATVASPACTAPTWSADSRHLLFTTTPSGGHGTTVQTITIDGTGRKTLGTTADTIDCRVTSIDGSTAYTVAIANTKRHVLAFDGAGTAHTITAAWPAGRMPYNMIAASVGFTRLLVSTVADSAGCGCSPPQQYAILDTATGLVTVLDNANDKAGSAPISGMFAADGRVVLIADRNKGNGSAVDAFLTVFGSDGAVLGSAPLPNMEYGYLAGFDN